MGIDADYFIRQNDTGVALNRTLLDEDDNPVTIENATVKFHLRKIGATVLKVNATAQNLQSGPATNVGQVRYTFQAADTSEAGLFVGEWQVTFPGGAIQTFPNAAPFLVRVTPQIG